MRCARPARRCPTGRRTRSAAAARSSPRSGSPPRSTSARCSSASGRRCSRTAARSTTRGSARSRRRSPSRRSATSTSSGWSTRPARRFRRPTCSRGFEPGHNHLVADDRVAAAVAELYGADPDAFTERRKALAAAAREAGDKQSAAAITALRKPTRAAWVVNQLARTDPDAAARMAALAADLRAAEQAGDGRRLRELSAERGSLLDGLVAQALAAAGTPDPPPTLRAEVTDTLTAALADP